jgi:hypothetical protein
VRFFKILGVRGGESLRQQRLNIVLPKQIDNLLMGEN